MNLIEKYGSYEAVKQAAMNYKNSGDMVTAAGLELYCLEYRRQKNIFEVGDKVVFLDEPIIRVITDVFTIKRVDFDSLSKGLILSSRDCDGFGYQNQMRHATEDEIKAGHRL